MDNTPDTSQRPAPRGRIHRPGRRLAVAAATAMLVAGTLGTATAFAGPAPVAAEHSPSGSAAVVPRLIVGYKSASPEAGSDQAAATGATGKAERLGKAVGFERRLATGGVVLDLPGFDAGQESAMIDELRADPDVAYVEPDTMLQAQAATPNDTEFAKQWDLYEAQAGMNVPGAWPLSTGAGVTVAVIDTGITQHSDLDANIIAGYNFISDPANAHNTFGRGPDASDLGDYAGAGECGTDSKAHNSSWHGTHVAGTIAAVTNNGQGVAGIAYNAKVQPVRVLGKCGGSTSDIADAIVWASGGHVNGVPDNPTPAKVINMSLGGAGACSTTFQSAIDSAVQRGTTVVVAAGNENEDASAHHPANCAGVISVAATNRAGDRAFYSNYGASVTIAGPGGETRNAANTAKTPENGILSTMNAGTTVPAGETYAPYMGTSMASPHIAGLAALILARKNLAPADVKNLITANARPIPGSCPEGCGAGLADATRTLNALVNDRSPVVTNPGGLVSTWYNAVSYQVTASQPDGLALTYSATGLPDGITIDANTGAITGAATWPGTYTVTVTATDTNGHSGSATFTWTVNWS